MGAVVFFDGVCTLCNRSVQFLLDHEREASLRFSPLQSEAAVRLLSDSVGAQRAQALREGDGGAPSSMVVLDDGEVFTESNAALRLARYLRAPWRWLAAFCIVPRPVRDWAYRALARRRYRWFGKEGACRVPSPELHARFL
jgi:predicted DCC family thiol-disulfide oxidoreductase YuxK